MGIAHLHADEEVVGERLTAGFLVNHNSGEYANDKGIPILSSRCPFLMPVRLQFIFAITFTLDKPYWAIEFYLNAVFLHFFILIAQLHWSRQRQPFFIWLRNAAQQPVGHLRPNKQILQSFNY